MKIQNIIDVIMNERGYICREDGSTTAALYNYRGEMLLRRVPLATVERVAGIEHVRRWRGAFGVEYIAHYLCGQYEKHDQLERCKHIAEALEEYAAGTLYKCPECDELHTITGEKYACPCGFTGDVDEYEQQSIFDYLADALDIEYRIGSDKEYRSCEILVAWGGPNIYIDTARALVKLFWWGDRAEYGLSRDAADAIDDAMEEYYSCI